MYAGTISLSLSLRCSESFTLAYLWRWIILYRVADLLIDPPWAGGQLQWQPTSWQNFSQFCQQNIVSEVTAHPVQAEKGVVSEYLAVRVRQNRRLYYYQ